MLELDNEFVLASEIVAVRKETKKFSRLNLEGPSYRREKLKDLCPSDLEKCGEMLELLIKELEERTERGLRHVDHAKFPSLFYENLYDEVLAKFGFTLDHMLGYCFNQIDDREDNGSEPWEHQPKYEKAMDLWSNLLSENYKQMQLFRGGREAVISTR